MVSQSDLLPIMTPTSGSEAMKQDPLHQTGAHLLPQLISQAAGYDRYLVAIAGPPGAGKSTLSEYLVEHLPAASATVLPMDGFHYDNQILDQLGLRSRKGAPETFDFAGFRATLERIRRRDSRVAVPVFDREADLARAGARLIDDGVKFIVVEGNYLLLDEDPWRELKQYFDHTIFVDVPREELQARLMDRWLQLGYSQERAQHWVETNDMPNVDRVLSHRVSGGMNSRRLAGAGIFLSALLLFALEPLVAKRILPWFGGSSAVWSVCLVFYQVALLAGYFYARLLKRPVIHIALLAASLLLLPIGPTSRWKPGAESDPSWQILLMLAATIGLPFAVLAATSPLLQDWLARSGDQKPLPVLCVVEHCIAGRVAGLSHPD